MGKLTLRLPRWTPPGTYRGSLELGGEKLPIVGEVEPRGRLDAIPRRLAIEAEPGGEVTVDVVLVNTGNVPCTIPAAAKFCVFDGSGIDHAFFVALASPPPEGRQRVDVLLDELAESHGGLVEARAQAGKRTIAPGESAGVKLSLRFSDRRRPGRSYAGTWEAEGLGLSIRVTVPEAKPRRKAAGAAT